MEERIINFLNSMDINQLIAIGVMFFFLDKRIHKKIDKLEKKIDKLDEKVIDIDRRVCRIEGILHTQDCCAIKASNELRKAE